MCGWVELTSGSCSALPPPAASSPVHRGSHPKGRDLSKGSHDESEGSRGERNNFSRLLDQEEKVQHTSILRLQQHYFHS